MELVQLICNSNQLTGFCHCQKYRNFTNFPGLEILWKGTVARKIARNYAETVAFHKISTPEN